MLIPRFQPSSSARSGATLVELMVAVAVISIGILGMFSAFRYIITSMAVSQRNTLATNLAQQQVEILKNQGYYDLLITTNPVTIPGITPLNGNAGKYDPDNYPPQSYNINGQAFTVYSYVAMLSVTNGLINLAGYNYPDTGMKGIQVNVVWNDRGTPRVITLTNLLENPNAASLSSGISGTISAPGVGNLAGALVQVDEHPSWFAYTNSAGAYSFSVAPGSWTVEASSSGYYSNTAMASCNSGSVTSGVNIQLTAVATGTIGASSVWYNSGLVISQVVGTTQTWVNTTEGGGPWPNVNAEYIELFNPTTYQINMSPPPPGNVAANAYVQININNGGGAVSDIMTNANNCNAFNPGAGGGGVFVSTYVAPGGYYLIANFPQILVGGQWVTADAYYNNRHAKATDCIADLNYGGIQVAATGGTVYDQVCWLGNPGTAPTQYCNGSPINTNALFGLNFGGSGGAASDSAYVGTYEGSQLVRFSSPAVIGRGTFGSAYNSQNNSLDFIYPISGNSATYGLQYNPYTVSNGTFPVIAGIPATGSEVAATDLLSGSTRTVSVTVAVGSQLSPWNLAQPYSSFTLVGVTTGTWSIDIATMDSTNNVSFYGHIDNIAVSQNATTLVPSAATSGAWPYPNIYSVVMSSTASVGFLKGQVTNSSLQTIGSPYIYVQASGLQKLATNGYYFLTVSTGTVIVTANPNNKNPSYTEQSTAVTVNSSQVTVQNFTLSRAGSVYGYVQSGTTAVPQTVVVAIDGNGNQAGQATTDSTGEFYITNITTGSFTIQPALPTGTSSSPGSTGVTITASAPNVFSATFSLTGALATFAGTVSYNSTSLISGALIIVSTGSIAAPPNRILGSNANTQTPIYAISSLADGSFTLPVQANSNPYNVLVSMPLVNADGTVTMHTNSYTVSIATPSTTVNKALTIP